MTIEGAIVELQNLIKADDVPFYYNGVIQKVIETIIDECKPDVQNVFSVNPPKGVDTPLKGDATVFHKNSKIT